MDLPSGVRGILHGVSEKRRLFRAGLYRLVEEHAYRSVLRNTQLCNPRTCQHGLLAQVGEADSTVLVDDSCLPRELPDGFLKQLYQMNSHTYFKLGDKESSSSSSSGQLFLHLSNVLNSLSPCLPVSLLF